MKKFVKACLVIALVFAIIGATGCAIGVGFGANKTILADTMRSDVVVTNITDTMERIADECSNWSDVEFNGGDWMDWDEYTDEQTSEYTFTVDQVKRLEAVLKAGDIRFTESTSDQVEVTLKAKNRNVQVETTDDGNLTIKDNGRSNKHSNSCYIVRVAVPSTFTWKKMEVKSSAGDVDFETDVRCEGNITVQSNAGDVTTMGLTASEIQLKLSAGDCEIDGDVTGDITLQSSAGDSDMTGTLKGDLDLTSSAGDVDFVLNGVKNDYNYDITSTVGSISIAQEDIEDGVNHSYKQDNGAEYTISASSTAGSLSIDFE